MVDELFTKRIPVLLKSQDKDDRKSAISICVEIHTTATPVHRKELVVRLTDESDLFFLHTLRLSEEEFQSLKLQQGLLVDFAAFPQKFIDLLDLCLQEEHKDTPKFILHLVSNGAAASSTANLNVVETNPFKHLTHLSLKFLPGTDTDVKKYLAGCLKNFKEQNQLLLHRLEHTESDLSLQLRQAREALATRTQELDALKTDWTSRSSGISAQHAQELNREKEKALELQNSIQQRHERERRDVEQGHVKVVKQHEARIYELETLNKDLTDKRYKSDSTIRELRSKLSLLEEDHHRAKQEVAALRKENASLDGTCHDQDKEINQLKTRLAVLEQEVKDKGEVMAKTSDLLGTEQEQKRKYEDEIESKKRHAAKLESSIRKMSDDLAKGNEIIQKLQGQIKNYHTKLKLRNQVTTEQEKLLGEKSQEMEEIRKELESAKSTLRQKTEENQKLSNNFEATMQKLEESRQLIKTNENVITWLNKQVTEMQLTGHTGRSPFEMTTSSTATFRPGSHQTPPGMDNFGVPSASYRGTSRMSSTPIMPSPVTTASNHPQVQFNPAQPRKSVLPVPIAKSSPIGAIPEEGKHSDPQASPAHLTRTNSKPSHGEPFLDSKYLQPDQLDVGRGAVSSVHQQKTTSSSNSLHFGQNPPVAASLTNPGRLSKDIIAPVRSSGSAPVRPVANQQQQPPLLASAYFPGGTKVT